LKDNSRWTAALAAGMYSPSWLETLRRAVAAGDEDALAIQHRADNHAFRARRALVALGGEATEAELLAWVEQNCRLRSEWRANLLLALHYHGEGPGDGWFIRTPGREGRWSLAPGSEYAPWPPSTAADVAPNDTIPMAPGFVARLIARGQAAGDGDLDATDRYLLALGAFELGQFTSTLHLLDCALADGLEERYRERATSLRDVCALKAGIL
jgi:hypothetical protein